MARTKAEVRAFLDSLVGRTCIDKSSSDYNGQCVCLIKNLMEFLGVPSPYAGRGNAITAGDAYIAQGIGTPGKGWLNVIVNRDMGYIGGFRYGHIWVDLANEANYESNGARALVTTKNTRPVSQGQQFINLDQWIKGEIIMPTENEVVAQFRAFQGVDPSPQQVSYYSRRAWSALNEDLLIWNRDRRLELLSSVSKMNNLIVALNNKIQELSSSGADKTALADLQKKLQEATDRSAQMESELKIKQVQDVNAEAGILAGLRAFWRIINRK